MACTQLARGVAESNNLPSAVGTHAFCVSYTLHTCEAMVFAHLIRNIFWFFRKSVHLRYLEINTIIQSTDEGPSETSVRIIL